MGLHDSLQQEVMATLLQLVSFDDGVIQSWTFLCFSTIAVSERLSSRCRDALVWDPIWTHAMRRANVPTVCRAACHTAHILLSLQSRSLVNPHASSQRTLTSHRVLIEIETLAKDLDVQGPSFPYDSVCAFLAGCLRVASQDVRLYRMQLEEKVVGWLIDCWRVGDARGGGVADRSRLPLHTIGDVLALLESICGFTMHSDLVCRVLLPDCAIVDTMVNEQKTKVIREFLLNANLPQFKTPMERPDQELNIASDVARISDVDLALPRGRERRISGFMLKSLEAFIAEWEVIKEGAAHPSVAKARRSLDTAVIALSFESLLRLNGVKSSRRVIQLACKLVGLIVPLLTDSRWTVEEKSIILLGLEPLASSVQHDENDGPWRAMVFPNQGTGIKTQALKTLTSSLRSHANALKGSRREFQRMVWQNSDVGIDYLLCCLSTNFNNTRSKLHSLLCQINSGMFSI